MRIHELVITIGVPAIIAAIYFAWKEIHDYLRKMARKDAERDERDRQRDEIFATNVLGRRDLSATSDLKPAAGAENVALPEQWQQRKPRHLWVVKALAPILGLGVLITWLRGQWHTAAGVAATVSLTSVLITGSGPAPPHPESTLPEATQPAVTATIMSPMPPPPAIVSVTPEPASRVPHRATSPVVILTGTHLPLPPISSTLPTLTNSLPTPIAPPSSVECVVDLLGVCIPAPPPMPT